MTGFDSGSRRQGPLSGVRVLSLENYLAGNHVTYFLGLFGADVIKVEQPGVGDALRGPESASGHLDNKQQNKRSIAVDLSSEAGREVIFSLSSHADVVFSNLKPQSLQAFGITFETLRERNPKVVYTTLSGFGHDDVVTGGPCYGWPAFDVIAQGMSGIQFRCLGPDEETPGYNGLPLGDDVTAIFAAFGTVMALRSRDATGDPQRVDVAMHDSMVYLNGSALHRWRTQEKQAARGRSIGGSAPYGAYRTKDGWVNIAVWGERLWRRFCDAIGRAESADDPRYVSAAQRLQHSDELNRELVNEFMGSHTTTEVLDRLHEFGIPCAPIYTTPEVADSPQVRARRLFTPYYLRDGSLHETLGSPIKMSSLDEDTPLSAPPRLGEHTAEVLQDLLGATDEEITRLSTAGAIAIAEAVPQHG